MILDEHHADTFKDYAKPLQKLEKKFNKAGLPITFYAFADPFGNRMVRIIGGNELLCLIGLSPAEAAKYVAKAVGL